MRNSARGKTKVALLRNYISFALLASIFLLKKTRSHHYDAILAVQLSPIFSVLPALIYGRFKKIKVTTWVMDLWPDILFALNLVPNRLLGKPLTYMSAKLYRASDNLLISSEGFRGGWLSLA